MTENINHKEIEFEVYLNSFYDLIKVNTPGNNKEGSIKTIIFYKILNNNLVISFNFNNYYITTEKSLNDLEEVYNNKFNNENTIFDDAEKPDFMSWINLNYMDNRGIKEI